MLSPQKKLKITITKTADGQFDYLQILSVDQFSLNIVLIAEELEVGDARPDDRPKGK